MTCLTCPSCQADLLTCSCRAIDERIRLALRSPEGKTLPIPYYNALVRRASRIISKRLGDPPPNKFGLPKRKSLRVKRALI